MFTIVGVNPLQHSPWQPWAKYIMDKKSKFGFKKAVIVKKDGLLLAGKGGMEVSEKEVQNLTSLFLNQDENNNSNNNGNFEKISMVGKTFILKQIDSEQLVAFNGSKYIIVCQTGRLLVIVLCDKRLKHEKAADWLREVAQLIKDKGH